MYVSICINDVNLNTAMKLGTSSGHALLNEIPWFILVKFKIEMPKNELHELCYPLHFGR